MQNQEYKTPLKKLARFFRISRDGWKVKFFEMKKNVKRLTNRIYDLEKRKESWKAEALKSRDDIKSLKLKIQEYENIEPIKKNLRINH